MDKNHKEIIRQLKKLRLKIEQLEFGNKKRIVTSDYVEILLDYKKNKDYEETLKELNYLTVFIETW